MKKAIWLVLLTLLVCCQTATPSQAPTPTRVASFTYSVLYGGLWQVDLTGRKINLLPKDDAIQKWHLGWSPDRKTLAYIARYFEPAGAEESLFVLGADGKPRKLMGPATHIVYWWSDTPQQMGVWSSDMRLDDLAASHAETVSGKWFRVDTQTGAAVETRPPEATPSAPLPSPDGKWSVAMEPEDDKATVYLVDSVGSKVAKLFAQPPVLGMVPPGHWSPDSHLIAFVLGEITSSDLYVFSLETKTTTQLTHYAEKGEYTLIGDLRWSPNSEWLSFAFSDSQSAFKLCVLHSLDYSLRCFDVGWKANEFVWSTDSRYVAFLAPTTETDAGAHDLWVLEAASGEVLNLTGDGSAQSEDGFTAP